MGMMMRTNRERLQRKIKLEREKKRNTDRKDMHENEAGGGRPEKFQWRHRVNP